MIATIILAAAVTALPQQFSNLPLESALQQAVQSSPDVAQARERVNENSALLAAARGLAAPSIVANYAASPQAGNFNNTVEQQLTTLGAQIKLGDYLAYHPTVLQAAFTLASAEFDLLDVQRAERLKVIGQYYSALKAAATLDVQESSYAGAQRDLHAAELRYRAGDAPRLDVVRAQVALAEAQANVDAAQVDLANAENALAVETGATSQSFGRAAPTPMQTLPSNPERAVERALAQRSDLASAQQAVNAEGAAVRVVSRGTLPIVTVNAGYTTGVDTGIPVHGPSATVNVALPISRTAAERTRAERARLAQAQYKADSIRRQITVEVSAAARTYAESMRAVQSASAARAAAEAELRATETGYQSGASSSLDVADARRTYVQAALAELAAVYAEAQAAATLEQEMGQ